MSKKLTMKEFKNNSFEELQNGMIERWINGTWTTEIITDQDSARKIVAELQKQYPYSGAETVFPYEFSDTDGYRYRQYKTIILYYKLYSEMPQLEQVAKAGFGNIIYSRSYYNEPYNIKLIKRNFKSGKNIKEICGIPPYAYEYFKTLSSINEWNEMRVLTQKYLTTKERFDSFTALANRYCINSLITKTKWFFNNDYYTPEELFRYLNRVDMYQAIEPFEAIQILKDYITMCKDMDVEPDLNTNSLKRSHDVALRNYYQSRQKINEEKLKERIESFKKFEFASKRYSIIAPKSGADIVNEGQQQRNCVGSYVTSVSNGQSIILFLRKTAEPEKSLVTVEISPKNYEIRQKYMSCNRPITDKNILNFIDKWTKYLDTLKS